MHYINSDGSIAKMCGNGIRCLAKFLYDEDVIKKKNFIIETLDGLKEINITEENNIRVNMGKFESKNTVSVTKQGINDMDYKIDLGDKSIKPYSIQFGVPHTVILEKDDLGNDIEFWGPKIENDKIYNEGTNVNFAKVIDEFKIVLKTWERGAGHTLSCGTGCCATAIILNKLSLINDIVEIIVEGGILKVIISEDIILIGPAIRICKGEFFNN
jgi:diaminopimelate epimerase